MRKLVLSLLLTCSLITIAPKKAEAGIGIGLYVTASSLAVGTIGVIAGSTKINTLAVGILTGGWAIGIGIASGGGILISKYSNNSGAILGGGLLILLGDESLENYEKLVDIRYPFIESSEARKILASELASTYEKSSELFDGYRDVHLDPEFLENFSNAFSLSNTDRELLINDLI